MTPVVTEAVLLIGRAGNLSEADGGNIALTARVTVSPGNLAVTVRFSIKA